MPKTKTTVALTIMVTLEHEEGGDINHIVNELDYRVSDTTGEARVADMNMDNFEIQVP